MPHKNALADLTREYLQQILHYNPRTGIFRWRVAATNSISVGDKAGRIDNHDRVSIGINNKRYLAHRLAWLYMTGKWPEFEIDHKDRNKTNNKWNNLREATPSQNQRNRGKQRNNTTGYKGVTYLASRRHWIAGIKLNGKRHFLGSFKSPELAHAAYCEAATRLHGTEWMHP